MRRTRGIVKKLAPTTFSSVTASATGAWGSSSRNPALPRKVGAAAARECLAKYLLLGQWDIFVAWRQAEISIWEDKSSQSSSFLAMVIVNDIGPENGLLSPLCTPLH
jgi:hypothetical protein